MKYICLAKLLLCFLIGRLYANCNNCDNPDPTSLSEKIYLQGDQIAFQESAIFIKMNDHVFSVPAIYSDPRKCGREMPD
jgi:hypothetical protein